MNALERFHACMAYKPVDRAPYRSWGPWPETVERWKQEGYDPDNPPDFGTDRWETRNWFPPNPPFEHKVIEEDERTILYVNHEGILMREQKENRLSSMPQFVRFPVETRDEFRTFWRERMQPDLFARAGPDWKEQLAAFRDRDYPLIVFPDRWGGFFGPQRNLLGVENLCMMFYDDPAFIEEMMDANADFLIQMMDQILDHTDVDVFGFWEDMAYKTGPLVGPELFRKFALPRYRRVVDFVRGRGVQWFCLDSDGDISELIPIWLDAGINILYPFEVQCGMDVVKIRKEYGRDLRMWHGVDKRALAQGRTAIDAELARVAPLVREGGYVPGTDHSIPPDVSLANYCYYMEKLPEIL
jgi:uroporphyrinogen decarboxylase-like protein